MRVCAPRDVQMSIIPAALVCKREAKFPSYARLISSLEFDPLDFFA